MPDYPAEGGDPVNSRCVGSTLPRIPAQRSVTRLTTVLLRARGGHFHPEPKRTKKKEADKLVVPERAGRWTVN